MPLRAEDTLLGDIAVTGADLVRGSLTDRQKELVVIAGAKSFSTDELKSAIAEQVREINENGVSPARADDCAYYLGAHYRRLGFSKAEVDYRIAGGTVILEVSEGPRTLLRNISFTGNKLFKDEVLLDYVIGTTLDQVAEDPEQYPYSESFMEAGADRVRGLYVSEGYLAVDVDVGRTVLAEKGTRADVTIVIKEGPRTTFGEVRIVGDAPFSQEQLRGALGVSQSGAFSRTTLINSAKNLESFLKTHGHYEASVDFAAEPQPEKGGAVPVTYTVSAGPVYRFGEVEVTNTTEQGARLRPDFLPKRFRHLKGKVYNPEPLDETFREMLRTGLFTNLRVNPVPQPDRTLKLQLTVEEAKSKEVGFTLGYGSYDGATIGIRLADRNLGGRGRPVSFAADFTQRGIRGELLYLDPWLFDTSYSLRARVYSADREEKGYQVNEAGVRFDVARKIGRHLELGAFIEHESGKITEAGIDPIYLGPTDYFLTVIGLTQSFDRRDNEINPSRGWVMTSALDVGLIDGEIIFFRGVGRLSYYKPIGRSLLALGARVGVLAPQAESIPIQVRFFNGGATTVRSFAERELGPKDPGGNPIGGEFYTVLNAEFMFPISGALQGAVFVDAGNLRGFDDLGFEEMRYGVGLGLRYKLPIGPLRLDFAVNPNPKEHEDFGAFHFSFGFAF